MAESRFLLLSAREDVTRFIPQVREAADREREAFGFLPHAAYENFALQERLIICLDKKSGRLAGYVIFGGAPPQARIFQTYVAPDARRRGVGAILVEEVIRRVEMGSFLSIRVEVASDLAAANAFYRDQAFQKVREKPGGSARGRVLITRVRELSSPNLLDLATYGEVHGPPVTFAVPTPTRSPLYLIDLNVLFDVTRRRGKALAAGRVFAAAMDNAVRMAASVELVGELERNTKSGVPDPVLELARNLPLLKTPSVAVIRRYIDEIGPLLFSGRYAEDRLTVQDRSDITHLATAIEEEADGFVTSEKAILGLASWFREQHRLEVISPEVFGKHYTAGTRTSAAYSVIVGGRTISSGEPSEGDEHTVKANLLAKDTPSHVIRSALSKGNSLSPRRRMIVKCEDALVAFGSWDPPKKGAPTRRLYLFADESDPSAEIAIDHIVRSAIRDADEAFPTVLKFVPSPEQVVTRTRAIAQGFRPEGSASSRVGKLEKLCLGTVVTEYNWAEVRTAVSECVGVILPANPPAFRAEADEIRLSTREGFQAQTSIGALEEFLSPSLFALRGRPGVIVPIKPRFAEALFRGSDQPSFLDSEQAQIMIERCYLSTSRTYNVIPDRGIIAFYESTEGQKGRSSAIAIGRIRRRYLAQEDIAQRLIADRGVLSTKELTAMAHGEGVCVTEFDNVMIFAAPIPLGRLKQIGCADGANLVTARRLDSDAILKLIKAGRPRCSS